MSFTSKSLIWGGGYAQGAPISTATAPKADGFIDRDFPTFIKKMREQLNWLNVNDPNIQAIITSLTDKTVGVSINTQVESPSDIFNNEAEEFLQEHGAVGIVDGKYRAVGELSGRHHFNAFVRNISNFVALSGGIIVRHHYSTAWKIPYRYELVGVDMIDINKSSFFLKDDSSSIINGIHRDVYGEITDIWLYTNPDKTTSEKVKFSNLTYYSEMWMNIDQQAAVSKLTTILGTLDQASQYTSAELQSAIEEAKAGHYIKSTAYNELMKIVSEEINKITAGTGLDRIDEAKDLLTPILTDMGNLGLKTRGLTPIPTDDTPIFNTAKKDSQYESLTNNSEKKIASALGLSDIGVYSKASDANYSSIKYTLETDQRTCDIRFEDISKKVLFEINSRAIIVGIQIGRISQRVAFFKNPNKFLKFRYLRQNKIDTEPAKNAQANKTNIAEGLKTKGQIIEQAEGIPYDRFLKKKHEQDLLEIDYGVRLKKAKKAKYEKAGISMEEIDIIKKDPL